MTEDGDYAEMMRLSAYDEADQAARLGITVEQYRSGKEALKENDKDAAELAIYLENRADVMAILRALSGTVSDMDCACRIGNICSWHDRSDGARVLLTKIEGRTP